MCLKLIFVDPLKSIFRRLVSLSFSIKGPSGEGGAHFETPTRVPKTLWARSAVILYVLTDAVDSGYVAIAKRDRAWRLNTLGAAPESYGPAPRFEVFKSTKTVFNQIPN